MVVNNLHLEGFGPSQTPTAPWGLVPDTNPAAYTTIAASPFNGAKSSLSAFTTDTKMAPLVQINLTPGTTHAIRDTLGAVSGRPGSLLVPVTACNTTRFE